MTAYVILNLIMIEDLNTGMQLSNKKSALRKEISISTLEDAAKLQPLKKYV